MEYFQHGEFSGDYWAVVSQDKRVLDWTQLKSKVLLSGALLFVITAVIVSSASIFRSDYEPLFTGLAIEDAAAITAQLEELNIDYLLEDSGTTIMVPADLKIQDPTAAGQCRITAGSRGFRDIQSNNVRRD